MSADTDKEVMETQLRREDSVAILTINNVGRRNAFSEPVREDMRRHLRALSTDKTCRAIVLTGAGGSFCSGGDVKGMKDRGGAGDAYLPRRLDRSGGSSSIIDMILESPKPVIMAIEGAAFGYGLALAAAGDYTVAASNARFAAAQIRMGLCPDGLMYYTVTARCGLGRAREILLSGREFNGEAAEKYGIAHEVTEPGKALDAAMEAAARYAKIAPLAFALGKSAMLNSYHSREAAFRAEQDYHPMVQLSKDHREAVAAFLEKRKPNFSGE